MAKGACGGRQSTFLSHRETPAPLSIIHQPLSVTPLMNDRTQDGCVLFCIDRSRLSKSSCCFQRLVLSIQTLLDDDPVCFEAGSRCKPPRPEIIVERRCMR